MKFLDFIGEIITNILPEWFNKKYDNCPTVILVDNGCQVFIMNINDLRQTIKEYHKNGKTFQYKGFTYRIAFYNGHFNGYIDEWSEEFKYLSENEKNEVIDSGYYPHGGYTCGNVGFDCGHYDDICYYYEDNIVQNGISKIPTFKTDKFVELECKRIIDSLIYGANCV